MEKKRYLHIRLDEKMFNDIDKNSKELGYNKSRWLREVIKLSLKNDSILNANLQYVETQRILSQIKRVGINLNQLTRHAHETGNIENLENIQVLLEEIRDKL